MIIEKLYEQVLIDPLKNGADQLCILSGYATSTMASTHLEKVRKSLKKDFSIDLVVGMCKQDGLSQSNHNGFQQLVRSDFSFECSYVFKGPPVHSKVYIWLKSNEPVLGFIGSANYTQNGFLGRQREVIGSCHPQMALDHFVELKRSAVNCLDASVEREIPSLSDPDFLRHRISKNQSLKSLKKTTLNLELELSAMDFVTLSLLDRHGKVPATSGLNWGQREGRDKNQAYISVPSHVAKSGFFPPRGEHFLVETDNGQTLICVIAQQGDKAIHTPLNNSEMGAYFRHRLEVDPGKFLTVDDLTRYGRTSVKFIKKDSNSYFLDFSVS